MTLKIISWNVNGLRAVSERGFSDLIKREKPSLLCVQETKIGRHQEDAVPDVAGPCTAIYSGAEKNGYSGVATFIDSGVPFSPEKTARGIGLDWADAEGRFLITHHRHFVLYNVYIPSGTTGDARQKMKYRFLDAFLLHLQELPKSLSKKLVICGDFNICHREIDIHHPETAEKRKLSGFLPEERHWLDKFTEFGFVDTFRVVRGDEAHRYSWWSFRAGARKKNLGWRIDYIFVSKSLAKHIVSADILSSVQGSDHCPVVLELDNLS